VKHNPEKWKPCRFAPKYARHVFAILPGALVAQAPSVQRIGGLPATDFLFLSEWPECFSGPDADDAEHAAMDVSPPMQAALVLVWEGSCFRRRFGYFLT
jgi:hypothetical protein